MSLWTSSVIALVLLQTAPSQVEQPGIHTRSIEDVAASSAALPPRLVFPKNDWSLRHAYSDVFKILSNENSCSNFYGGPRAAITVFNDFAAHVRPQLLLREISFQMEGKPRFIRDHSTGVLYRLFDKTIVNRDGAFYQRRVDLMDKFPSDVGSFFPGSRGARALILLHELAHLIQGENGMWLIPDDGHDGRQSKANTLRIEEVCRAQLNALH